MSWELGWVLVVPALAAVFLSGRAGRLDRLHLRLEGSREALDAQLVRRAGVVLEISASGLLDPAASLVLADAAEDCVAAEPANRAALESALSQVLRGVLDDAEGAAELAASAPGRGLLADMATAAERVVFARRFHNDAVAAVQQLRRKRLVRWFRLAGHAAWPEPFEIDDRPPLG